MTHGEGPEEYVVHGPRTSSLRHCLELNKKTNTKKIHLAYASQYDQFVTFVHHFKSDFLDKNDLNTHQKDFLAYFTV